MINNKKLIKTYMDQFNFQVDLDAIVGELPIGVRQKVEILKMVRYYLKWQD